MCLRLWCIEDTSRLTWERAKFCFPHGATVVFVNHHLFIVVFAFCLPYRFTFYFISRRRLMNACQSSSDPLFRALLWSRFHVFTSFSISEVMDGFCKHFNFTVFIGAWLSKQVRNRSLKASSFPSTDSIKSTVSQGIWAISMLNCSAL